MYLVSHLVGLCNGKHNITIIQLELPFVISEDKDRMTYICDLELQEDYEQSDTVIPTYTAVTPAPSPLHLY